MEKDARFAVALLADIERLVASLAARARLVIPIYADLCITKERIHFVTMRFRTISVARNCSLRPNRRC